MFDMTPMFYNVLGSLIFHLYVPADLKRFSSYGTIGKLYNSVTVQKSMDLSAFASPETGLYLIMLRLGRHIFDPGSSLCFIFVQTNNMVDWTGVRNLLCDQ